LSLIAKEDLQDNVILLNQYTKQSLSNLQLHGLYVIADMVFYFSKGENFGLPIIEAFTTKTPIYVSNLEVFHEIGESYINYVDVDNVPTSDTALNVASFIQENKLVRGAISVRRKFNLETILRTLLIPII
jgi:glycosyltransferase involved in cell wall biosynthesis